MNESETYTLADLTIEVGPQRVTRAGTEIHLPRLSFDLLLALVRAAPNVLSNSDLMERVWKGLVVTPETVNQRAKLLRDALGDDPREPRYIEGLRSRGYRIIAPVVRSAAMPRVPAAIAGANPDHPVGRAGATAEPTRAGTRIGWVAVAAAVLAGLAFVALRPASAPQSAARSRDPGDRARTVAVLPFEDLSQKSEDAFLTIGIPEMVLDRLAGIPDLRVIARESSFRFRDGSRAAKAIGDELHAGYLVQGTVQRIADQIRVSARLVRPEDGTQVWSSRFDRPVGQVFSLQDDIAASVAQALAERTPLSSAAMASHRGPRSQDTTAQLAYLRGRALLARYTVADSTAAAAEFESAIALDPAFAAAYASLYDARLQATERRREDLHALRSRERPLLDKALSLDPACGSAYFARAIWNETDPAIRDADFKRGVALDPSNSRGLIEYEFFLTEQKRDAEAMEMLRRALAVDPLSARANFRMAQRHFSSGDVSHLESDMKRVLELDPTFQPALQRYAKYRWQSHGELVEAIQLIERAVTVDPQNPWSRHTAAAMYLDLEDPSAAFDVASGTDSSTRSAGILLAQWRGDWRTAAQLAYSPAGSTYNPYERWGVNEAIRDSALLGHDRSKAIDWFSQRLHLEQKKPLDIGSFRPAVYLAQLLIESGEQARGQALLNQVLRELDASIPKFGPVYARRTRAALLLILGQRDNALAELARSFHDRDYTQWWYTLNHDPLWKPVHADPRFKALSLEVHEYIATQRRLLAELRDRGQLPRRPSTGGGAVSGVSPR